jgi:hypothetical protein
MGGLGMYGWYTIEICVYNRKVTSAAELDHLRQVLGRLDDHLRQAAAGGGAAAL